MRPSVPPAGRSFPDALKALLGGLRKELTGPTELPRPVRPTFILRGIIESSDGKDMALVEIGSEHRIVMSGEELANDYRVSNIAAAGLELVHERDRYVVPLGDKKPASSQGEPAPDPGA